MNLITGVFSLKFDKEHCMWYLVKQQLYNALHCTHRLQNVSEIIYDDWWIIGSIDWLKAWQHMINEAELITLEWNT